MWIRQEYKSNKDRFEKPFFLATPSSSGAVGKLKFIQSYAGLGTTVWDGAIALARLFDNQCGGGGGGEREVVLPFSVEGKSVIEMGAGCGLVGIYLQKCHGAKCVVLTDQEMCLEVLQANVDENGCGGGATSTEKTPKEGMKWTTTMEEGGEEISEGAVVVREHSCNTKESTASPGCSGNAYDVLICAECAYDTDAAGKLAHSVGKLAHHGSLVYLSCGRNRRGKEEFRKVMQRVYGFGETKIPVGLQHRMYRDEEVVDIYQYRYSPVTGS
eukprot:Nk52_evm6s426 gene=Nk52_evmTU6s426